MLRQFHSKLRDGGLLLLAIVLPFKPFVEKGYGKDGRGEGGRGWRRGEKRDEGEDGGERGGRGREKEEGGRMRELEEGEGRGRDAIIHTFPTGAHQAPPSEHLPVRGGKWEEGVCDLVTEVLQPIGFSLVSVSKLPYLCEGDLHTDYFVLQDAVLVLSKGSLYAPHGQL